MQLAQLVQQTCGQPHALLSGRATTGLYLVLAAAGVRERKVVLPANICYSLVNAVTLSGNRPLFVDVDPHDGNMRLEAVAEALAECPWAVVLVHGLGNPCPDTLAIAAACRQHDVMLVEDCAALPVGEVAGRPVGSTGDYALFSFGSGKTIDAGGGGLLAAGRPLDQERQLNNELPLATPDTLDKTALYASLYRLVHHSRFRDELLPGLAGLNEPFAEIYRFRSADDQGAVVGAAWQHFATGGAAARREVVACYDEALAYSAAVRRYPWQQGAVPWRYNLLVDDPRQRQSLIDTWLAHDVPVSTWYGPVAALFGDPREFPGAARFGERIVNLPLTIAPAEASRIGALACEEGA